MKADKRETRYELFTLCGKAASETSACLSSSHAKECLAQWLLLQRQSVQGQDQAGHLLRTAGVHLVLREL